MRPGTGAVAGGAAGLLALGLLTAGRAPPDASGATAVPATCPGDRLDTGDVAAVVARAQAFAASLDAPKRGLLSYPFTRAYAVRWSNLPISAIPRIGVRLGTLDERQDAAALALVAAATSRCGKAMFDGIRASDQFIRPVAPFFDWGRANFFIAFLGAPSTTKPWMLKIGGHHLAYNFTFNGRLPGATPLFNGTEPIRFALDGRTYAPLAGQSGAMSALAKGIARYPEAHLAGTFTDVVKGVEVTFPPPGSKAPPQGGNDTGFPSPYPSGAAGRGIVYGRLTADQQRLVRNAMAAYAALPGQAMSRPLLATYEQPDMLAQTYVGYSGRPDLGAEGSYVRVDGPRVWMELVVQQGVAFRDKLHYHALWRDKLADYGGEFSR